jgi:hypothetical protein
MPPAESGDSAISERSTLAVLTVAAILCAAMLMSVRCGFSAEDAPAFPESSCARVAQEFVGSGARGGNRYLDFFRSCGDIPALGELLGGLVKPHQRRSPPEIIAAIGAMLNSSILINNSEATAMLARTIPQIPDPDNRVALAYAIATRGATAQLLPLLQHDPSPEVRMAAIQLLAQSAAPPFDDRALFVAARSDTNADVRAQAWLALLHLKRLRTAAELHDALNVQRDTGGIVRVFDAWFAVVRPSAPDACAARLVTLAENGSANEAIGALAAITEILATNVALPARHGPIDASSNDTGQSGPPTAGAPTHTADGSIAASTAKQVRAVLASQRVQIARAALARFTTQNAPAAEGGARVAFMAFAAANGCDSEERECSATPRMLAVTDWLAAPLATEASAMLAALPSSGYLAWRRHQYLAAATIAVAVLAAGLAVSLILRRSGALGILIAASCAVALAALLQCFATGYGVSSWPPLKLWPATSVGNVTLTTMIAASVALAARPGWRRALTAVAVAEALWWLLPVVLAAGGITMGIQRYGSREDILLIIAPIAGAIAVPVAAIAVAGFSAAVSGLPFTAEDDSE